MQSESETSSESRMVCDPIVLNFHESLLRQSDIELLSGNYWLNDTLISFYYEYLERIYFKDYKNLLFVPPQVTQCIKLCQVQNIEEIRIFLDPLDVDKRDFIFFALNGNDTSHVGGTHWSLVAFSRPENKIYHFDSSAGANHNSAWELGTRLMGALGLSKLNGQFEESKCLQQTNGYDCGLHLLCNTENIAQFVIKNGLIEGHPLIQSCDQKRSEVLMLIHSLIQQGYVNNSDGCE